jgi:tetratricopeptide (TPR) repeat protein
MRHTLLVCALAFACSASALPAQTTNPLPPPASASASQLPPLRSPISGHLTFLTLIGPRTTLGPEELKLADDVQKYLESDWTYEADESIRRFLLLHPDHLPALLLRAVVVRSRLDPVPAKPLFESVVRASKDSLEGQCAALMLDIDNRRHPTTAYRQLARLANQNSSSSQVRWLAGIAACLVNDRSNANTILSNVNAFLPSPRVTALLDEINEDATLGVLRQSLQNRESAANAIPAAWTHIALSHALARLNRNPEAEQAAARAANLEPKNVRCWIEWAETLIRLHRYPDALDKCQKALALDPNSAEAAAIYGFALDNSNRLTEALTQYKKAAGIKDFPEVLRPAGEILGMPSAAARTEILKYLSVGRQTDAETIARQLAVKYPDDEAVQFMQAVLVRSRFDVEAAFPFFRRVITLAPDSARGQCAQFMLNIDARIVPQKNFDDLCDLARQHPADAFLVWTAAIAARTLNCNLEGVEFYNLLCRQFSAGPSLVHQTYGNILAELRLYELALAQRRITVAMESAPWSVDTFASTLGHLRFFEASDAAHNAVTQASPQSRQYWLNWAIDLHQWGHHDDAIAKCRKMLELNPSDAAALYEWGWNLEAQDKLDEALTQYQAAARADPGHTAAASHAAAILRARALPPRPQTAPAPSTPN